MDANKARHDTQLRRLLTVSVAAEALTGVALFVFPSCVARLLLGAELSAEAEAVARLCAIALLSLVTACGTGLHRVAEAAASSLRGMLAYNAMAGIYLTYIWALHETVGVLLLAAAAIHVAVALALGGLGAFGRRADRRRPSSLSASNWPKGPAAVRRTRHTAEPQGPTESPAR